MQQNTQFKSDDTTLADKFYAGLQKEKFESEIETGMKEIQGKMARVTKNQKNNKVAIGLNIMELFD